MNEDISQNKVSDLNVTLERVNEDYLFEAKGRMGVPIPIDNITVDGAKGASPMELLLMGVGGCSAIDIIYILKKQRQKITNYKVEVTGHRKKAKEAKPFTSMHLRIHLEGEIDPIKAKKAAQLSFDKYCSVSITFENSIPVTYDVSVNGAIV